MESITEAMLRDDLNAVQVWINALKSARRLEGVYARVVQALAITRDAEERQEKILQVMDGLREQAAELEGVVREAERRAAQAAGSFQEAERKSTEAIEAVRREHADALRRLEKEMPEILYRKHRYVDAAEWGEILARAGTMQAAELDQVGASIADLCVGKSAREIRTMVDEAVAKARRHVARALEELCSSYADNASR